jgi:uncharacterized membrane protein YgcG
MSDWTWVWWAIGIVIAAGVIVAVGIAAGRRLRREQAALVTERLDAQRAPMAGPVTFTPQPGAVRRPPPPAVRKVPRGDAASSGARHQAEMPDAATWPGSAVYGSHVSGAHHSSHHSGPASSGAEAGGSIGHHSSHDSGSSGYSGGYDSGSSGSSDSGSSGGSDGGGSW